MSLPPLPAPRRFRWLAVPGVLVLCGVWVALGGAGQPADEPVSSVPLSIPAEARTARAVPVARALLAEARVACARLRDYRCTLTTRERLHGRLQPEQTTEVDLRVRPLAVHLRWRSPASSLGQEVWYDAGRDPAVMRVRPAGYLGGVVGIWTVDPHGPSVRANSRHAITDAGMGNMLEAFAAAWESSGAAARLAASKLDDRDCRAIELVAEGAEWRRAVLHVERATGLPVRVEYHDGAGRLLDEATYRDVEPNVGLGDGVFAP